jgi:hypothetical protein
MPSGGQIGLAWPTTICVICSQKDGSRQPHLMHADGHWASCWLLRVEPVQSQRYWVLLMLDFTRMISAAAAN